MRPERPSVSVVVPFYGDAAAAGEVMSMLARLRTRAGDEAIVVDNTPELVALRQAQREGVKVISSPVKRSAYTARNVGAEAAAGEWLLFVDADCRLPHSLLEAYFAGPLVDSTVGAVAGEVAGAPEESTWTARYARARSHLSQAHNLQHAYRPMAVTANLLVRREAWADIGGFAERTRSGADNDFCWRLQDAGWGLDHRPGAVVEHHHRERLAALMRQTARDGAAAVWLNRRHPGSERRYRIVPGIARCAAVAVAWTLRGRFDQAAFKVIDALWIVARNVGHLAGNASPVTARPPASTDLVVFAGEFPRRGERSLVASLERLQAGGRRVWVEAAARPRTADWAPARCLPLAFLEDDGPGRRVVDVAWLLARHPVRCMRHPRGEGASTRLSVLAPAVRRLAGVPRAALVAPDPREESGASALARLLGRPEPAPRLPGP